MPIITPVKFSKISAGADFVLALSVENGLYSWGNNRYGQLGVGDLDTRASPTEMKLPKRKLLFTHVGTLFLAQNRLIRALRV